MSSISPTSRPGYVYDSATDTWIPIGIGPHTHAATDISGVVDDSLIDARGDLIVGTAADTPGRLAVGANGTVLRANNATATGLEWATISSTPSFSGCSVSKSAAQTLASNTATIITFDTELFDVDGYHSNSVNNSRMTIPNGRAGYFFLYAKFRLDAGGSTGGHVLRILKNGTAISEFFSMSPASIAVTGGQISQVVNGAVGDYFEIDVRQLTTGNQDMPGGPTNAQFMISYLGA